MDAAPALDSRQTATAPARLRFAGTPDALYERHLKFDNVVELDFVRRARALRSRRPRGAGHSLGSLAAHRRDLRAGEPEAGLLHLDRVSDRPLARQQRHESHARSLGRADVRRARPRVDRRSSTRSRTRAWATAASAGSPPASSIPWRRCSFRRWATDCATSTASSGRRSATAGRRSGRTIGCVIPTPGRWCAPTRASR